MTIYYRCATLADTEKVTTISGHYHQFESINIDLNQHRSAIQTLLSDNASIGFIVVAISGADVVGYLAICYGYSIEYGGKDAFIDEFYVLEHYRAQGIGQQLIHFAKAEAKRHSVRVLHLEVSTTNELARGFYRRQGFASRERFHLMSCLLD